MASARALLLRGSNDVAIKALRVAHWAPCARGGLRSAQAAR